MKIEAAGLVFERSNKGIWTVNGHPAPHGEEFDRIVRVSQLQVLTQIASHLDRITRRMDWIRGKMKIKFKGDGP